MTKNMGKAIRSSTINRIRSYCKKNHDRLISKQDIRDNLHIHSYTAGRGFEILVNAGELKVYRSMKGRHIYYKWIG